MPYDPAFADQVRKLLKRRRGLSEREMFGGLCFLLHGNMCCGVIRNDLVLRLGEDGVRKALKAPGTRPMDFTGKPLKSMVYLSAKACRSSEDLRAWVSQAVGFCQSLPRK